ncbi:MAG: FKBP-type peptidyl-prolyl cis-trans isomerase [Bacteroidales bacterium]|nr:FKBP-type peptidyl-prolyl cis-trans isomerase [Bacteroidales bacterium]MBO7479558.1 FKBP-type peptidyl-prolyl cis-trans isomerase [Bacteroidales bacterium]MBO7488203.1 FKBP-type peptidyl-prolyl cis-trans isomerase [Bacteroidales bacterium]
MKKPILLAAVAIAAAIVSACTLDDKLAVCITQEEAIEKFIENKYADSTVVVTESGISRILMVPGSGTAAQPGDSVIISYLGYIFNNGPGVQFTEGDTRAKLGGGVLVKGLDEGIVGMTRGEEAYIAFSARNGFFNESVGAIPHMTPLIYYVKLEDIYK